MIKRYTNRLAALTWVSQSDRTISVKINVHDLFLGQATVLNGVGDYHGQKYTTDDINCIAQSRGLITKQCRKYVRRSHNIY